MKPLSILFFFVLFYSCQSSSSDGNGGTEDSGGEGTTITEYDMDENRLGAVDFNNELSLMQQSIMDQVTTLFRSDSASVDINLENTLFEIGLNIEDLKQMQAPENGQAFLEATLNLMHFYEAELSSGFKELVPLIKAETLTRQQEKQLEEYDVYFAEQEMLWFDTVFVEQEKFARANNIKLAE